VSRLATFILLQVLPLLLVSRSRLTHPAELYESDKDLARIAESDADVYHRMIHAGAKVLLIRGRKPFLVYWIPEGFDSLPKRRVLVVMHGTNGNAYHHLSHFLDTAKQHKFGILSVQWGWPRYQRTLQGKPEYDYIRDPRRTYDLIKAGLAYLDKRYGITQGECAWLGFSRSSTQCAVFAHLDKNEGEKYFALFIAVSGGIGKDQPIMRELFSGEHGLKPLAGQHFYLWAGKKDRRHGEREMRESKTIIERLGGTVDILRIGEQGHGGFNHNRQYQEEAWALWNSLCSGKREPCKATKRAVTTRQGR